MFTNPRLIIDDSTKNSKLYPLSFGTNLIGRAPNCQVSIIDDKKISREHCALVITKENVHLIDLESGNGTFSKNQKIDKIALTWGDEFTIGLHHCIFVYDKKQNEIQVDHSTSATITHIPTKSLIQKSQSAYKIHPQIPYSTH
jgi:pSer/pThr/pTyr-binding forkhead associated (FHA) protein